MLIEGYYCNQAIEMWVSFVLDHKLISSFDKSQSFDFLAYYYLHNLLTILFVPELTLGLNVGGGCVVAAEI